MFDLAEIEDGGRPWKPTPTTVPVEILHRYNMPLVGVFEQRGVRYLFQCWAGEVERANLWLYTRLGEEQDRLRDQSRPITDTVDEIARGEGLLAVALDGRIVAWEPVPEVRLGLAEVIDLLSDRALGILQEESRAVEALRTTAARLGWEVSWEGSRTRDGSSVRRVGSAQGRRYHPELVWSDAGPVGGVVEAGPEEVGVEVAHVRHEVPGGGAERIAGAAGNRDGHAPQC